MRSYEDLQREFEAMALEAGFVTERITLNRVPSWVALSEVELPVGLAIRLRKAGVVEPDLWAERAGPVVEAYLRERGLPTLAEIVVAAFEREASRRERL